MVKLNNWRIYGDKNFWLEYVWGILAASCVILFVLFTKYSIALKQ